MSNTAQKSRERARHKSDAEAHEARKIEEQKNTASMTLPSLKMRTHRVSLADHREAGIIEMMRDESEPRQAKIKVPGLCLIPAHILYLRRRRFYQRRRAGCS